MPKAAKAMEPVAQDPQRGDLARLVAEEEALSAEKREAVASFNERLKDRRAEIRQLAAAINAGARRLPGI